MVWDLHCHLAGLPGRTPAERLEALVRVAKRMGIDRVCVYMGLTWSANPTPTEFRRQNDAVMEALGHWMDPAFGFVYLNPNFVQESLEELDRCVRDGPMVGVKLWIAKRCDAKELDPIVERATALGAIVFQHTWWKSGGNEAGESTPMDLVELAKRHPKATIVCGHTGGDWERGVRAIREMKNVYADLAGSDPTAGLTEMTVRELGAERVLFGSDAAGRSFASQLAKVTGAEISEREKELVLGENLRRALTPILRKKGVAP